MSGLRQTARMLDAASNDVQPKPCLRQLIIAADYASRALSEGLASATDAEYTRLDDAAFDAKQALLAALWADHGIDRHLASKFGEQLL